jgi:DNA-binding LacI/PurR family transcriptional regulator
LHAQGRRRIAILGVATIPPRATAGLLAAFQRLGLETRPYWNLQLPIRPTEAASTITRLLMQGSPSERPDGLVITDDHLIEAVTTGLSIAGLRTGLDVDVVGAVNFPYLPASAQPICRLGFDLRELLKAGIEQLRLGRAGDTGHHRSIPARFADEIAGRLLLSGNPV